MAPAAAATSPVWSVLPSSQTRTTCTPGSVLAAATVAATRCSSSLAGMMHATRARAALTLPRLVLTRVDGCGRFQTPAVSEGARGRRTADRVAAVSGETAEVGVNAALGVRNEVGRLRTVMLHRPGNELRRLTPRNNDALLFDGLPWVDRAQEEHDAFADALRARGVEVLYLSRLLVETLADPEARAQAIELTLTDIRLGDALRTFLNAFLAELDPDDLAEVMMAGLRNDEVRGTGSLVAALQQPDDFLIDPLPNLLFTRDSSVWVQDRATITSLAMPARRRETQLTELIYRVPSALRRGGADPRLGEGVPRGRRRAGPGRRRARRRRRRADPAVGRRAAGPDGLRPGAGAHRAGGADRPGPGDHAPGHHLHHGRRRRGGDVPERRAPAAGADRTRRGRSGRAGAGAAGAVPARGRAGRWASTSSG